MSVAVVMLRSLTRLGAERRDRDADVLEFLLATLRCNNDFAEALFFLNRGGGCRRGDVSWAHAIGGAPQTHEAQTANRMTNGKRVD